MNEIKADGINYKELYIDLMLKIDGLLVDIDMNNSEALRDLVDEIGA